MIRKVTPTSMTGSRLVLQHDFRPICKRIGKA